MNVPFEGGLLQRFAASATAPVLQGQRVIKHTSSVRVLCTTSSSSAFGRRPTSAGCARCCCSGWLCRGADSASDIAVGRRLQVLGEVRRETSALVAGTDHEPAVAVPGIQCVDGFLCHRGRYDRAARVGKLAPESRVALNHECIAVDEEILSSYRPERAGCGATPPLFASVQKLCRSAAPHRGVRWRECHLGFGSDAKQPANCAIASRSICSAAMASTIWR